MEETPTVENAVDIRQRVDDLLKFCLKKDMTTIRRNDMAEYKQVCMKEFSHFHCTYPTLFFSIVENPTSFPKYRLEEMLRVKERIEKNEITDKTASIAFGQKYYNEFVKDVVKKLDDDLAERKET